MKKLKSSKKLNLAKSTISKLNESQLEGVNGGTGYGMCIDNPTAKCVVVSRQCNGSFHCDCKTFTER